MLEAKQLAENNVNGKCSKIINYIEVCNFYIYSIFCKEKYWFNYYQ